MKPMPVALTCAILLASLPATNASTGLMPPMNLDGHYDAKTHTVNLAWDPPLDADSSVTYKVYQDGNLLATIAVPSFVQNAYSPGTVSTFSVTAIEHGQESVAAYHVIAVGGILETCGVFLIGPSPGFPYVGQINWDCIWSILHVQP
jgi:hypothetical protein